MISSAAAIMIAVFFGFALSDVTPLKQIGVGLALAVLIDATLVRGVLVPAAMQLMGRWNWWFPSVRLPIRLRGSCPRAPQPRVAVRPRDRPCARSGSFRVSSMSKGPVPMSIQSPPSAGQPRVVFAKRTVSRRAPEFEVDLSTVRAARLREDHPCVARRGAAAQGGAGRRSGNALDPPARDTCSSTASAGFDVPYDEFISRVDIGHVGQFYRDSLGVTTVVVNRDELGRTRHQGVRVVALPQPNYAAFMLKEELDVYKLEKIDYSDDEQRVWMVTVHSPNGSAVCDDGYMSFSRAPDGVGTVVAFLACQNFPVPPLMALARLDRWTWFKRVVTEDAYRRFFNAMMRSIDRCYRGQDFHVGRALAEPKPIGDRLPPDGLRTADVRS